MVVDGPVVVVVRLLLSGRVWVVLWWFPQALSRAGDVVFQGEGLWELVIWRWRLVVVVVTWGEWWWELLPRRVVIWWIVVGRWGHVFVVTVLAPVVVVWPWSAELVRLVVVCPVVGWG